MTVFASSTSHTLPAKAGLQPPWQADLAVIAAAVAHPRTGRTAPPVRPNRKCLPSDTDIGLTLSATPHALGPRAWRYWCPRLAPLAGLSSSEMAVLRADQMAQHGRQWWIVGLGDAPRIRSSRAHSPVPVSHHLINDGFLDLVQAAGQARPDGFLFPTLAQARRPGDAARAWMRRWAVRNLPSAGVSLQELRICFASCLADSGCSQRVIDDLLGLVPKKSVFATPLASFEIASSWLPKFQAATFPGYRASADSSASVPREEGVDDDADMTRGLDAS